jgi:hypothetical protein
LRIIDLIIDKLESEFNNPARMREILITLVMDLAVRSTTISERKAWETISLLISAVSKTGKFPDEETLQTIKASISSLHRNREERTSSLIFSLKMFELGEHELREFLQARAWDGLPGFGEPLESGPLLKREERIQAAVAQGKKKRSSFDLEQFLEWWLKYLEKLRR